MYSNTAKAFGEGSMTALIMLDFSAAFDLIDQLILLKRLAFFFGIKKKPLTWLKSYLTNRTSCISVTDKTSPDVCLHFGVPDRHSF